MTTPDFSMDLSQSELRLPLLQVVSSNKYFSVGVQSPTEINAPAREAPHCLGDNGLRRPERSVECSDSERRCQLALTRITHQVSRAFDLNYNYYSNQYQCVLVLSMNTSFLSVNFYK